MSGHSEIDAILRVAAEYTRIIKQRANVVIGTRDQVAILSESSEMKREFVLDELRACLRAISSLAYAGPCIAQLLIEAAPPVEHPEVMDVAPCAIREVIEISSDSDDEMRAPFGVDEMRAPFGVDDLFNDDDMLSDAPTEVDEPEPADDDVRESSRAKRARDDDAEDEAEDEERFAKHARTCNYARIVGMFGEDSLLTKCRYCPDNGVETRMVCLRNGKKMTSYKQITGSLHRTLTNMRDTNPEWSDIMRVDRMRLRRRYRSYYRTFAL